MHTGVIDTRSVIEALKRSGYVGTFKPRDTRAVPAWAKPRHPAAQITDSRRMTHAGPTPSERALSRVTVGLLLNVNTKSADMKTYTRLTRARAYLAARVKRPPVDRDAPRAFTVLTPLPVRRVSKSFF